jgi:hypothetical protein
LILKVENAPKDAYAATFELDASASYDPVHTLKAEPDGGFRLETSTSGDSSVVARLHLANGKDLVLKDGIVRGLRRTHGSTSDVAPLGEALSYIADTAGAHLGGSRRAF